MAVLYTPHFVQFLDDNGDPLSNGKLFTYAAGTTSNKATFTTAAATVQNPNPVILDSAGRAVIFIEGSYRFDLFDSNDNLIKSVDNVTSFATLTESASAFFQSFSGDGNTTAFVLSTDLGTDEKTLMVFVDDGLNEYVTNGNFATDTDWTKGSGWVIGSGVATATTASTALTQDSDLTLIEGQSYNITYTITRSAGTVTPSIGGTSGEARNASGTFTETIIAGSTQAIAFTGASFSGTVDNVSVTNVQSSGANILNPNQYTLNGTNLTFVTAPASGTNNILVFAPSQLAGAASAAASAAQAAEAAAVTAQAEAEAAAGLLNVASASSVLIGTGTKTFTIAADKGLTAGQFVLIDSDADVSNYMYGQITDYTGTTLEVNVLSVGGSGTYADWTITLIGIQGLQGETGSVSATSAVQAATSAGATLQSNNGNVCLTWGAGGGVNTTIAENILVTGSSSAAGHIILREDTDNGTNGVSLYAPASVTADRTITLPDADGTVALVGSQTIGAWTSYTPTFTGFGTVSGLNAHYRRVGNDCEVMVTFTTGTTTAVIPEISLPSGLTIDGSIIGTREIIGFGSRATNASASDWVLGTGGDTTIETSYLHASGSGLTPTIASSAYASSSKLSFKFSVPVTGW